MTTNRPPTVPKSIPLPTQSSNISTSLPNVPLHPLIGDITIISPQDVLQDVLEAKEDAKKIKQARLCFEQAGPTVQDYVESIESK
jgi:hypothetical protein